MIEPWLEEIREPAWHGQPAEVTIKAYNDDAQANAGDRWSGLSGGEAVSDFVARIRAGCTDFLARHGVRRQDTMLPVWDIDDPAYKFRVRCTRWHQQRDHLPSSRPRANTVGVGAFCDWSCIHDHY